MEVKIGNKVKVHYKGTLSDGTIFDESRARGKTLDFEVGAGEMIKGFDEAIPGMKVGDVKTFSISPEAAYGPKNPDAVVEVSRDVFPSDANLTEGMTVHGTDETGNTVFGTINQIKEDVIVVDHNHPMAGEKLSFEVELIEIETN